MVNPAVSCQSLPTTRDQRWPYEEYYLGDRDSEDRKSGQGENHWTGAESLEWYIGPMLRDTMHGEGDYRWRHKDPDGAFVTYEGPFFANHMHGYGMMSYPDGRVFTGLFYNNARWGPGIEQLPSLQANVGLWRGTRLVRLSWKPPGPPAVPNLATGPKGPSYLNPFRIVLKKNTKTIDETNSAIELLKHFGADPVQATKTWTKLYPKYCTDINSVLCDKDLFDRQYYKGKIYTLEETTVDTKIQSQEDCKNEDDKENDNLNDKAWLYYAWNNSPMMLHMMKHCYQHEKQRSHTRLNLEIILNGPRKKFRSAAKHETDCRTLLMSSYVGNIANVTQLVNEEDVFPDIADSQGNTALIYAVCGDQIDAIHFLIEAGASVNSFNDSCCTPLGIALMRYTCAANDVLPSLMIQALLPPKPDKSLHHISKLNLSYQTIEWYINREASDEILAHDKLQKISMAKKSKLAFKSKSKLAFKSSFHMRSAKATTSAFMPAGKVNDSDNDIYSNEKKQFLGVKGEYSDKVASQYAAKAIASPKLCLFTANNMLQTNAAENKIKYAGAPAGDPVDKANAGLKKVPSKATKSKRMLLVEAERNYEKEKSEMLSKIYLTILQLLTDGADPKLVKCPRPALLLAMKSGCRDLVRQLVSYGADVNETFPELLHYSALDLVISEPFTDDNLEMIRTLLEVGADVNHRLSLDDAASISNQDLETLDQDGPTLLHAVIARKTNSEHEKEIRKEIIDLLLKYNADPTAQFRGRSPIECAMMCKLERLDLFIKNPVTNLNAIINKKNQTILVKLFSKDFFKSLIGISKLNTITNLLLYGADPLIECFDGDRRYENVFEFANKTLKDLMPPPPSLHKMSCIKKSKGLLTSKSETKRAGESEESKKKFKEISDYTETLKMLKECAQLLHIRWLQANLIIELIDIIIRFKHRHWTMIIKEHKNAHNLGLWVTVTRCLEIWGILKITHKKKFTDENILRILLRIVLFYQKRIRANEEISNMKAVEKDTIETDVKLLMKEHSISDMMKKASAWKTDYVKPELDYKNQKKYQVCFECGLRLREDKMTCDFCGLVSFCDFNCMSSNYENASDHPCNKRLIEKYTLPSEDDSR